MEEEKKSTNSNDAKLPWTLVARAYSVLVALVIGHLPVKQHLELLNDIIAEAKTEDVEMRWYRSPRDLYGTIMRRINQVIVDRLVKYNEDTATVDEHNEVLDLRYIRDALDGVSMKAFECMLTTVITDSGDAMFDKLREYRIALKAVAPDSANAIIADIEMRYGYQYTGPQYGAPTLQPPMQQPWPYASTGPSTAWRQGNPVVNQFGQSVNPFYQPNMYNNQYRNGNPFQDGPSRPFTPNNGSGFGDMSDVLGGDNGKKK